MPYRHPARLRIHWLRVAVLLLLLAALAAALSDQLPASSSSSQPSRRQLHAAELQAPHAAPPKRLGEDGGAIPDGTTVFDTDVPGVAKLDPALLEALQRAATDSGVAFTVDSGWRSAAYQSQLLQGAVLQYGSRAEAARWVATPRTSAHVSGDAVDLGSTAAAWLSEHGAVYGLCQIYDNESWHYELRPQAIHDGCPPRYADPTHDPRMHQ